MSSKQAIKAGSATLGLAILIMVIGMAVARGRIESAMEAIRASDSEALMETTATAMGDLRTASEWSQGVAGISFSIALLGGGVLVFGVSKRSRPA